MDNEENESDDNNLTGSKIANTGMHLSPDPQAQGEGHPDDDDQQEDEDVVGDLEEDEDIVMDELTEQEYSSVNRALDEMLTFMDVLEERSNNLFSKMQELLADSRQTREEMQAAREDGHEDGAAAASGTDHQSNVLTDRTNDLLAKMQQLITDSRQTRQVMEGASADDISDADHQPSPSDLLPSPADDPPPGP